MPLPSLNLFRLLSRGVNVVTAATHLTDDEASKAQNAEIVPIQGEGGFDQRPGMTKINSTAVSIPVLVVEDVPPDLLSDLIPYLYAGMYTGSTHNWRRSLDGTTWADVDTPSKPFSNVTSVGFFKNWPKAVTIGKKLYFLDSSMRMHQWDGTNDNILSTIPPAVTGVNLTTPAAPTVTYQHDTTGATTYTYKVVAINGASHSIASAGTSITTKVTLDSTNFASFDLGTPVAGATSYDVYRTVGGATQGKIGSVPIVGGAFSFANGSGRTGITFITPSAPAVIPYNPGGNAVSYKIVPKYGSSHGVASAAGSGNTDGVNRVSVIFTSDGTATSYDIYRTSGGGTTGLIGTQTTVGVQVYTFNDTLLTGDASTPPATLSGLEGAATYVFTDGILVGDASVAPVAAVGTTAGNPITSLDMITDGTSIYCAVLDAVTADPDLPGRLLQFNPNSSLWTQIGANFKTVDGHGTAGTLGFHTGALNYGTYIGTTAGNTSFMKSTGNPLPGGGIGLITFPVSRAACAFAMFLGNLYIGEVSLVAAQAARVIKRVAIDVTSVARTGPATAQYNAYTSLAVYNGILFAGWTSGDGGTAARIESSPDGVNWTSEVSLDVAEVVSQFLTFNNELYVVLGKTGVAYNTKSRIMKRTMAGVWSAVDDPSDDFAGCIGIVYT